MDFTALFSSSTSSEQSFLFLFSELRLAIPVITALSMIRCVDLLIFLLLLL
jgi:hypothetical protein